DLFCAEYCGLSHSYMLTEVKVLEPEKYDKWLAGQSDTTGQVASNAVPGAAGKKLTESSGCIACHSNDGSKLVGPSFKGIFGHEQKVVTNGQTRTVVADEAYIMKSIYEPDADVVEGFRKGQMVSYKGQLNDEQVNQIIEYLKTLQ
ncbi:MAG: c-type cytochrome, partial [Chloroflexota bacterium]